MTSRIYKITSYLAVIGIFLALYLLYQYYTPPHKSLCYVNSYVNCEASTKGPLANTLGIPTGFYGLAGYLVILISAVKKWKRLLLFVATFGVLFCLRITFLELFVVKALCPVCIACQVIMFVIFILALWLQKKQVLLR